MKDDIKMLLYNKINMILLKEWDPIGIQNIPEAYDEYESYVSPIIQLLISGKVEKEIFNHLWWIETKHMGLQGNKMHTSNIAKKLFGLLDKIERFKKEGD